MRNSKFFLLLNYFLSLLFFINFACAFAQNINISEIDAKNLVLEALKPNDNSVDLYSLPIDYSPGFYVFEIISLNPKTNLVVGHIAVNQYTGDVWDISGNCKKFSSNILYKMQSKLTSNLKISDEVTEWRVKRPNCDAS